jgi:hypothetical protein
MKTGLKWGLLLGAAVCLWTLGLHVTGLYTTNIGGGQVADQLALIFPIAAVTLALRERRRQLGGTVGFKDGIGMGAALGAASAVVTVPFLWIYHHFINPRWLDHIVDWRTAQMKAAGASAADIESTILAQRASGSDVAQITSGVIGSILVCTILAIIVTLLLRFVHRRRSRASTGA